MYAYFQHKFSLRVPAAAAAMCRAWSSTTSRQLPADGSGEHARAALVGRVCLEEAVSDLRLQVAASVGQEDRGSAWVASNLLQHIEILGEQQQVHHISWLRALHVVCEHQDGVAKAVDDGFPLPRDAGSREVLGLCVRLCCLDLQDLVGFGLLRGRLLQALGLVDPVHRVFDSHVRGEIGHQRLDYSVAILLHDLLQGLSHVGRDLLFAFEGIVEVEARDGGADNVVDVGRDLLVGVGKLVERLVHPFADDLVLHRHHHVHEDVVFRLRLAVDIERLHAHGHAAGDVVKRTADPGGARMHQPCKAPISLFDPDLAGGDALDAAAPTGGHSDATLQERAQS
mmetsp:Transcript_8283/g.31148  ORF Transcript_8283/g.31148 Transcript_8283/m.31148 type:complete len:340 (+) Transcript_8283:2857-3876(+)